MKGSSGLSPTPRKPPLSSRPAGPTIILDCGHVEVKNGKCETIDCPNFIGVDPVVVVGSMVIMVLLLGWVRLVTGRGALTIIMDHLPSLVGS